MEHRAWSKLSKIFLLISFLIAIDQLSKYIIRHGGGFYICNPNMAFGLQIPPVLFWLFWILIIGALIFKIASKIRMNNDKGLAYWVLILIVAGALANIIDRWAFGCVIDFIDLKVWPVFNLADVFISLGVIILLVKGRKIC